MTKNGKEFHSSQLYYLKEKLLGYGADPLTLGDPINLLRGEKVDKNVDNDMRQVEILGKEKMNELIQEPLMNKKSNFLIQQRKAISKLELNQKKSQKMKLFQLFKRIAKHFELPLTYP